MTGRRSAEEQNLSHLIAECGRLQWQGVRTKAGELPLWGTSTDSRRRPTPSAILWDEPTFAQPPGKAADAPSTAARRRADGKQII